MEFLTVTKHSRGKQPTLVTGHMRNLRWPAMAWLLLVAATSQLVALPTAGEYQIKAAMISHFASFVKWPHPPAESSPLVIGIIGEDPFGPTLDRTLEKGTVAGRALIVRRIRRLDELKGCQILFISRSESGRLAEILALADSLGLLTVGDTSDFATRGGIIGFRRHRSRVGLEVNLNKANAVGLRISSKLLRLATVIKDEDPND